MRTLRVEGSPPPSSLVTQTQMLNEISITIGYLYAFPAEASDDNAASPVRMSSVEDDTDAAAPAREWARSTLEAKVASLYWEFSFAINHTTNCFLFALCVWRQVATQISQDLTKEAMEAQIFCVRDVFDTRTKCST